MRPTQKGFLRSFLFLKTTIIDEASSQHIVIEHRFSEDTPPVFREVVPYSEGHTRAGTIYCIVNENKIEPAIRINHQFFNGEQQYVLWFGRSILRGDSGVFFIPICLPESSSLDEQNPRTIQDIIEQYSVTNSVQAFEHRFESGHYLVFELSGDIAHHSQIIFGHITEQKCLSLLRLPNDWFPNTDISLGECSGNIATIRFEKYVNEIGPEVYLLSDDIKTYCQQFIISETDPPSVAFQKQYEFLLFLFSRPEWTFYLSRTRGAEFSLEHYVDNFSSNNHFNNAIQRLENEYPPESSSGQSQFHNRLSDQLSVEKYVTSVGLYNQQYELLMIVKIPPLKLSPNSMCSKKIFFYY